VIGIDNFDNYYSKDIKLNNLAELHDAENFRFLEVDILNKSDLSKIFVENKIDLIIHLAAKAGVRPSIENPDAYFKTNIEGTLNLLNCTKEFSVKNLFSLHHLPFTETMKKSHFQKQIM